MILEYFRGMERTVLYTHTQAFFVHSINCHAPLVHNNHRALMLLFINAVVYTAQYNFISPSWEVVCLAAATFYTCIEGGQRGERENKRKINSENLPSFPLIRRVFERKGERERKWMKEWISLSYYVSGLPSGPFTSSPRVQGCSVGTMHANWGRVGGFETYEKEGEKHGFSQSEPSP